MNIDSLKYFYDVAKIGSISVVAKNNHISQSALSQQLFKLEDKLEAKLFIRSNKGVSLTKEGLIVLKHCESIFESYDKITKEIDALKDNKNIVTIKAPEVISSTLISSALVSIRKRYNKLNINLYNSPNILSENSVLNEEDIVLSYFEKVANENRVSEVLLDDELIFITNSDLINDEISLKSLMSTPLILVKDSIDSNKTLEEILKLNFPQFKKLNIILTTQSYYPAISSCKGLNSLILIPKTAFLSKYKFEGFKQVRIADIFMPLTLYLNYSESLLKSEKRFIIALKKSILDAI